MICTFILFIISSSRGESSIVINKLTDQLKEQKKQFENLKKQERDTMEGDSVQESHVDSFTSKRQRDCTS